MTRIYLNGAPVDLPERDYLGRALLDRFAAKSSRESAEGAPPYLFCGNGSCRDCNALVDGLSGIPTCRIALAPELSVRPDPETALSRHLPRPGPSEPFAADVVVVGGGRSGRLASGGRAEPLEARAPEARPVGVEGGRLVLFERGGKRPIDAARVVLATGARDAFRTRADVLPMDLVERYVERDRLPIPGPAPELVLDGEPSRVDALRRRLVALGAAVRIGGGPGGTYVTGVQRAPSLELARALGCRTRYDRERATDVLVLAEDGETSVRGVFATGSAAAGGLDKEGRKP